MKTAESITGQTPLALGDTLSEGLEGSEQFEVLAIGYANELIERNVSQFEEDYRKALAPFDEQMQLTGEPPIEQYFESNDE